MSSPINIDERLCTLDGLTVVDAPATPKQTRRVLRRVSRRRFLRIRQRDEAIELLRPLPAPGESVHGIIPGTFSGWVLAAALIELLDAPADVHVCTLGFNRENCRDLTDALDAGRVRSVVLLVSDYFRSSDRDIFRHCQRELESRGQRVAIGRSHAKLMLFQTTTHNMVAETSANLRSSQNIEQFVISDDPGLLEFHRAWIEELLP